LVSSFAWITLVVEMTRKTSVSQLGTESLGRLAVLMSSSSVALLIGSKLGYISEPYSNWQELFRSGVEGALFLGILSLVVFSVASLAWNRWLRHIDNETIRGDTRRFLVSVIGTSCVAVPFGFARFVIDARSSVDLMQGQPVWFQNLAFDFFGGPAWIIPIVYIWIPFFRPLHEAHWQRYQQEV
jgi:hypothetical protein